ncbi:MAG TPA: hypothetical protein VFB79_23200 [Candidatus Angelobacter sp.]|nr:hypothetical protein [Candidatus Angelobacter sp.]
MAANVQPLAKVGTKQNAIWSIGIYTGSTLCNLSPAHGVSMPVLSAQDVTDIQAKFVADPFMIHVAGTWHMFFEVLNGETNKGDIGWATSQNGLSWNYQKIVLTGPFHLSYPYVFSLGGEYYMVPESYEAKAVQLYRAAPFPTKWVPVKTLLEGPWVDSSIFYFRGQWWMFSNPLAPAHQVLELFYADQITGPWHRHPMSPIVQNNPRMARSAGKVIVSEKIVTRFTQDCAPYYGAAVRAFEISELTTTTYGENELERSPILLKGQEPWHQSGMHHIDAHWVDGRWFACVDGWRVNP